MIQVQQRSTAGGLPRDDAADATEATLATEVAQTESQGGAAAVSSGNRTVVTATTHPELCRTARFQPRS